MKNKLSGFSGNIQENVKNTIDNLNVEVKNLFEEIFSLGKSSVSLAKMLMGKDIGKRQAELTKNQLKDFGSACISFTGIILPGGKKILPILSKIIEKPPVNLLSRVVDENMKLAWLENINETLKSSTLLDKIINKVKGAKNENI